MRISFDQFLSIKLEFGFDLDVMMCVTVFSVNPHGVFGHFLWLNPALQLGDTVLLDVHPGWWLITITGVYPSCILGKTVATKITKYCQMDPNGNKYMGCTPELGWSTHPT